MCVGQNTACKHTYAANRLVEQEAVVTTKVLAGEMVTTEARLTEQVRRAKLSHVDASRTRDLAPFYVC